MFWCSACWSFSSLTSFLILSSMISSGVGICATALYRYQSVLQEESELPKNIELWSFPSSATAAANKKQCVIIGGGVVGVTAAYKLALKGHSVVLLEPNSAPGKEVSTLSLCVVLNHLFVAWHLLQILTPLFLCPAFSALRVLLEECNVPIQQLTKERG